MEASFSPRRGMPDISSLMKTLGDVDDECVDAVGKEQTEQIENLKVQVESLIRILGLKDNNMEVILNITNSLIITAFYELISDDDIDIREKLEAIEAKNDNMNIAQELLTLIYENHILLPKYFDTLAELLERIKDFVGTASKSEFTKITSRKGPSIETKKLIRDIIIPQVEIELRERIRNELEPEIRRQLYNSASLRNEIANELRGILSEQIRLDIENEAKNNMIHTIRLDWERDYQSQINDEKSKLQIDFDRRIKEIETETRHALLKDQSVREKIANEEREKIINDQSFRKQIVGEEKLKIQDEILNNQYFRNMIINEEHDRIESEFLNNPIFRDQIISQEKEKIEKELQSKFEGEYRRREDSINRAHANQMDILREQFKNDPGVRSSIEANIRPLIESRIRNEFDQKLLSINEEHNNELSHIQAEFDRKFQEAQQEFNIKLKMMQDSIENEKPEFNRNNKGVHEEIKEALLRELPLKIEEALKSDSGCQNNASEVFSLVIKALGLDDYSKSFTMERFLKQTTRLATDVEGARTVFNIKGTIKQCILSLIEQNRSLEQSQTMTRSLLVRQSTEIDQLRRSLDGSEWLRWCKKLYGEVTGFAPSSDGVDEVRFAISEEVSSLIANTRLISSKANYAFSIPSDILMTPTMKTVPQIGEVDNGSPPTYSPSPSREPQSPLKSGSPMKFKTSNF